MDGLVETLVQVAAIAVTWPIWGPALRLVLRDVRAVAESDGGDAAASASATRRPERARGARVVNPAWDDARVGRRRGSRLESEPRDGFVTRP